MLGRCARHERLRGSGPKEAREALPNEAREALPNEAREALPNEACEAQRRGDRSSST